MRAAPTNSQTQQRKRGQSWQTELGPHFLWWWSQVDEGLGVGKEAQLKGGEPEPKGIQDCDTEVDGRLAQKVGSQVKSQPSFQPWEIGPVSMMSCTQFFPGHLIGGDRLHQRGQPPIMGSRVSCYARFLQEMTRGCKDMPHHTSGYTKNPPYFPC